MGDSVGRSDLEKQFEAAMYEIYDRAGHEIGYWATRYLQMLRRRGGLDTAHYLLSQKATSDGYRALRDAGRLDLTVEAYVLRPEFQPLFSAGELDNARERLAFYDRLAEEARPAEPVDPELARLLTAAQTAPPDRRIALCRDRWPRTALRQFHGSRTGLPRAARSVSRASRSSSSARTAPVRRPFGHLVGSWRAPGLVHGHSVLDHSAPERR